MSPLVSESRMAAQLAPLVTFELMPYFLKNPFSWAMTIGEQSVSAIMPKLMSAVSGPSAAPNDAPCQPRGTPERRAASAVAPLMRRRLRRETPRRFDVEVAM